MIFEVHAPAMAPKKEIGETSSNATSQECWDDHHYLRQQINVFEIPSNHG
jgi:hypothetical protein